MFKLFCRLVLILWSLNRLSAEIFSYTLTDLGTLGGSSSTAYAINDNGVVVGTSSDTNEISHSFICTNGKMVDLGSLGANGTKANALNVTGTVVGSSRRSGPGENLPFIYSDGVMSLLQPDGDFLGVAAGINDRGQVVGTDFSEFNHTSAFLHDGTGLVHLSLFGYDSYAFAINANGMVVGAARHSDQGLFRAYSWDDGVVTDLGTLNGSSFARAVNDNGVIVGRSFDVNANQRPFRYVHETMEDLGTLGGKTGDAYGINNEGTIVGYAQRASLDLSGFVFTDGQMIALDTLVSPESDWKVRIAYGINRQGQIVGVATNSARLTHACLLTPIPRPPPLNYQAADGKFHFVEGKRPVVIEFRASLADATPWSLRYKTGATPPGTLKTFPLEGVGGFYRVRFAEP